MRTRLSNLINQTGIETLFGDRLPPLPSLTQAELQALSTDGLLGLQRNGVLDVAPELLAADPPLQRTYQILVEPEAVVRVSRQGLESEAAAFWVFERGGDMVHLTAPRRQSQPWRVAVLADSAAVFDAIQHLLPIGWVAHEAYAHCILNQDDAVNVFTQSQAHGLTVATELLVSDGLTQEQAEVAFNVMLASSLTGRISFLRLGDDDIELAHGLAVGQDGGDVWMCHWRPPVAADRIVLETVLQGAFHRQLEEGWAAATRR